jgi:hypothetical protein
MDCWLFAPGRRKNGLRQVHKEAASPTDHRRRYGRPSDDASVAKITQSDSKTIVPK